MRLAPPESAVPRQGTEILVICADPDDRESLLAALHGTRWRPRVAENCAAALSVLQSASCSVAICAAQLPDGTWKDVLDALRRRSPTARLIVFSRSADERLWSEVLHLGGYDLLQPPFESRQLLAAVGSAWLSAIGEEGQAFGRSEADYRARLSEFESKLRQLSADLERIRRGLTPGGAPSCPETCD